MQYKYKVQGCASVNAESQDSAADAGPDVVEVQRSRNISVVAQEEVVERHSSISGRPGAANGSPPSGVSGFASIPGHLTFLSCQFSRSSAQNSRSKITERLK